MAEYRDPVTGNPLREDYYDSEGRPTVPPGTRVNSRGEPYAADIGQGAKKFDPAYWAKSSVAPSSNDLAIGEVVPSQKLWTQPENPLTALPTQGIGPVSWPSSQSESNLSLVIPKNPRDIPWEQAWPLIVHYESGGRNIHQQVVDPKISSASGYGQITNTNWRKIGPQVGIDTSIYPTAISAPKAMQEAVAKKLFDDRRAAGGTGFEDWAPFNPALARRLGQGGDLAGIPKLPAETNELAAGLVPKVSGPAPQTGSAQVPGILGGLSSGPWARLLALSMFAQSAKFDPIKIKYDPRKAMLDAGPEPQQAQLPSQLGALAQEMKVPVVDYGASAALPQWKRPALTKATPSYGLVPVGHNPFEVQSS